MTISSRMGMTAALVAMLLTPLAYAGGIQSEKEAVSLAESAMKKIVADDIEGATEFLRPYASMDWGELNAMTKHVAETYRTRPAGFGDPLGYAYATRESVSDTVLRVTFIEKFKRKPLLWEFYFYKPEQNWLLWGLTFNASEARMFNLAPIPVPQASQPAAR